MSNVRLVSITQSHLVNGESITPEQLIVYMARVSNPNNQEMFETAPKLLKYLIKNKHWSPFEMVDMTVEIETSRAIAAQILRHKSFSFQEFSLRYSPVGYISVENEQCIPRSQDIKNRQNSIDDLSSDTKQWFLDKQSELHKASMDVYNEALLKGIAKECARMVLPLSTKTKIYMKGSIRSWIHYFLVRCDVATQKEHRDVALAAQSIMNEYFPNIKDALEGQ